MSYILKARGLLCANSERIRHFFTCPVDIQGLDDSKMSSMRYCTRRTVECSLEVKLQMRMTQYTSFNSLIYGTPDNVDFGPLWQELKLGEVWKAHGIACIILETNLMVTS